MMARFLDGPVQGTTLQLRNCPHFLRVTIDAAAARIDALDQPADVPEPAETLAVYVVVPHTVARYHVRPGGRYMMADYRYLYLPVEILERVRDRPAWIEWVKEHGNAAAESAGLDPWHPRTTV